MRTETDNYALGEYEGGTLAGIRRYFSTFEQPFIKGLLKDKGVNNLLYRIEDQQNHILIFMQQLLDDFNNTFSGVPIYLYMKRDQRHGLTRTFTLLWRVSRSICGADDNSMITHLFSKDGRCDHILRKFGPRMLHKLRDYDKCRLQLNMAENLLRYQKRSVRGYRDAMSLI